MIARAVRLLALVLLFAPPMSVAQAEAIAPLQGVNTSDGMAAAFEALRGGSFLDALDAAERAGPVARDVVEWQRLREGLGSFEETLAFLRRRPDWPGLPRLRSRNEELVPRPRKRETAEEVLAFLGEDPPVTGEGVIALVQAYRVLGRDGDAKAQAALAWLTRSLGPEAERSLLTFYPEELGDLDEERMDAMFWAGSDTALRRAMARAPESSAAKLAAARLAARLERILETIYDGGIAHIQFERLLAQDRDAAVQLLLTRSISAEDLGNPTVWARERRTLARRLMEAGEMDRAYAVASSHGLTEGADYAELEWLSGFLSLRFRDQPQTALMHFQRFREAVATPISLGRAGYWIGRAHSGLDQPDLADEAYRFGARYQTSFYGLLAAEEAGLPLDPMLTGAESFPLFSEASFRDSSVLEAALLLQAAGERDLAERFFTHLAEGLDREEAGTLGDLVLALGEPHLAVRIAKRAAEAGITIPHAYYPVIEFGVENMPVSAELALAIARRESELDPGVASGVGARGLMQLMPGTARDVARALDIAYSPTRLFSDPSYNATLGTAYLAGLIERFGNNPILVAAGYNAGPGRPIRWMRERGDPRSPDVDVIDWIELIPFDETRNYVMRVAESLPVYRARLSGTAGPIALSREIAAR